jgi:hypothetical protein
MGTRKKGYKKRERNEGSGKKEKRETIGGHKKGTNPRRGEKVKGPCRSGAQRQ